MIFFVYSAPSGAPQLPSGRAISPYLIDIMWSPPPEVDINGVIEFYLVEVVEVLTGRMWTLHAVEEHIIVGPLNAGYAYTCHIAAFTIGQGPFTNYFIVHSQELGMIILILCMSCNYSVHISWLEIRDCSHKEQ